MISDESLAILKETAPELWRELTRRPATHPQPHAPKVEHRRTVYNIILALYPEIAQAENDDGDIIEGEWRNVA